MADSELSDLTAAATLAGDELVYVVDAPGGTPLDRKATVNTVSASCVIAETVLGSSAATIDIQNIPATYRGLVLDVVARLDGVSALYDLGIRFNNDSGSNYDSTVIYNNSATTAAAIQTSGQTSAVVLRTAGAGMTASQPSVARITIPGYRGTTFHKLFLAQTASPFGVYFRSGLWMSTAAIDRITLVPPSVNFVAGSSATLYGYRAA